MTSVTATVPATIYNMATTTPDIGMWHHLIEIIKSLF